MDKKEVKDSRFYSELIIITVIVLVTANLWVYIITSFLERRYPRNLKIPLIIIIVITFTSILLLTKLSKLFGRTPKATLIDLKEGKLPPYKK